MTFELGTYGVWHPARFTDVAFATEIERLGYRTLWLGGSPDGSLALVDELLAATNSLRVATGIVNVWNDRADVVAESFARVEQSWPGRFLLGIGIGHPEATEQYHSPYDTLVAYVDDLLTRGVPANRVVLAALGPRVLRLAGSRVAGAHPYLTTPEHTRRARELIGPDAILAPEQKVVVADSPHASDTTREIARPAVQHPYLGLVNYRRNLLSLGWAEADIDDGGSDALIDALVLQGDGATVTAGIDAHLDAGADHVAIQVLGDTPLSGLAALSEVLTGDAAPE